ncbi:MULTISPECIES: MBL fold metallo-hydrolase [Caldimonas]|jgi:glyoxylase-like metal-dependent hydrolase (beta-lactamase superfamily II)|uniref:MBL fold metallo-hydrolase n=1 Tax=Caldimonas TaxID=196013 RepID=UPI000382912B|nr:MULTISPECIES: MBL fold metallo-hydrolase [Caldimonas]GIX24221.1 MAG: MBL fold metallo-hydrolase [Caldimonas sp.]
MDFLEHWDEGITVIDTGFVRARFDAAYLIVENGRAAFVDTGPNSAVPRLLAALQARQMAPEQVDWLIVTHVHLDHAGGAGLLLQHLPNAKLVVHPRGARHLVDPRQLMAGVRAVYGPEVAERDYGELQPVPPQRVLETHDGMVLALGGRALLVADTPGHARHHHCIWDEASRGWFTGDTFGIAYPDLRTSTGGYAFPTTTPVQFEPEALLDSIDRLLARDPQVMFLTHFGATREVAQHAAMLRRQLDAMVRLARSVAELPDRHARLRAALAALYGAEYRRAGGVLDDERLQELLEGDVELNAQGLGVWLDKQAAAA